MLESPYQKIKELDVISYLYAASTEKMTSRILSNDPEIKSIVETLQGDEVAIAQLLQEAKNVVEREWDPKQLHPDEMVLIAVLHVLGKVSVVSARLLCGEVLGSPQPALVWTRRFADWLGMMSCRAWLVTGSDARWLQVALIRALRVRVVSLA